MQQLTDAYNLFFQPITTIFMLVYLCGWVQRRWDNTNLNQIVMGVVFGLAAVQAMQAPILLADGFIFDLRNIFVACSVALFGWKAGVITLGATIAMRMSVGGAGMYYGIIAIVTSSIAGLTWRHFVSNSFRNKIVRFSLLGVLTSAHLLVAIFIPYDLMIKVFTQITPIVIPLNIAGTVIIGLLIHREETLIQQARELARNAATDPLTKLMNRRSLEEAVQDLQVVEKPKTGRAVLFFDIDHFKGINDKHGHIIGDAILQSVVERIQTCLRPNDIFSRLGGDEFAVVLPDVARKDAEMVAERCRRSVSDEPFEFDNCSISATISIGCNWTGSSASFDDQLNIADAALYKAKDKGRNAIAFLEASKNELVIKDAA